MSYTHGIVETETTKSEGVVILLSGRCQLLWDGLVSIWERESGRTPLRIVHHLAELSESSAARGPIIMLREVPSDQSSLVENWNADLPEHCTVRVVGILMDTSERVLMEAMQTGFWSFASVFDSAPAVLDVIHATAHGRRAVAESLDRLLHFNVESQRYQLNHAGVLQQLTKRQREIMGKLAAGESVKQVAKDMHLSSKTVESHKYRIMQKLGLHDRVQITRLAIREGMLTP